MKLTSSKHTRVAEENRRNWEKLMKKIKEEMREPLLDKLAFLEGKTEKPSYIR